MSKKMFSRFNSGIFILILFTAFLSSCKQSSPMEEGLVTTAIENGKSINQTETVATAAAIFPSPIIEWPNDFYPVIGTLTPEMCWVSVPGATHYQYSVYLITSANGDHYIRKYTSNKIPAKPPVNDCQTDQLPSEILTYGTKYGYKWCIRALQYNKTSEYTCSTPFQVLRAR